MQLQEGLLLRREHGETRTSDLRLQALLCEKFCRGPGLAVVPRTGSRQARPMGDQTQEIEVLVKFD